MAALISSALLSLDGYIADANGNFDWAAPTDEVHAFVNQLERPIGTYLYGRRMYEVMSFWETAADELPLSGPALEYSDIWHSADKIVYSRTLPDVQTPRTRIERSFDASAVRALKAAASRDISIGGPEIAAEALAADLIDEIHLFVTPILVGDGTPFFPHGSRVNLTLRDEHRFDDGTMHLHYLVIH